MNDENINKELTKQNNPLAYYLGTALGILIILMGALIIFYSIALILKNLFKLF